MRQRFRKRQSGTRQPSHEGMAPSRRRRIIRTMFWSGAALLLLFVVLGYDRSETKQAQELVEQGRQYEADARYDDAIREYQRAFENPRLSRPKKGDIAVAIGNIEFDHFKDYNAALAWYQRARRVHLQSVEKGPVKQRVRKAEQFVAAAPGAGLRHTAGDDVTTTPPVFVQQVELVGPPPEDQRGPVLARFRGGALHGGELIRALRDVTPDTEKTLRNNPARFEQFVRDHLTRNLRYQAALEAGLHRDPTVKARLYEYQRTLIADRYSAALRERAQLVSNDRVEEYYQANESRYRQPAKVSLAMIKTDSAEAAAAARADYVAGYSFSDVATSHSLDEASARTQGVVGVVAETDQSIPGVGHAPDLVRELVTLQPNDVTAVTRINDAYFIFRIVSATPSRLTTLEEARPQIEAALRREQGEALGTDLSESLLSDYQAEISSETLKAFWEYMENPVETTPTLVAEGTTVTTGPVIGVPDGATTPSLAAGGTR